MFNCCSCLLFVLSMFASPRFKRNVWFSWINFQEICIYDSICQWPLKGFLSVTGGHKQFFFHLCVCVCAYCIFRKEKKTASKECYGNHLFLSEETRSSVQSLPNTALPEQQWSADCGPTHRCIPPNSQWRSPEHRRFHHSGSSENHPYNENWLIYLKIHCVTNPKACFVFMAPVHMYNLPYGKSSNSEKTKLL